MSKNIIFAKKFKQMFEIYTYIYIYIYTHIKKTSIFELNFTFQKYPQFSIQITNM